MFIWEGVSEFVAVVERASFTQAAQQLQVSTAHVSRQVSALEARLGIKLLYRTTRTVSVTEAGQQYYQHCRVALDGLEEAQHQLTQRQAEPQGKLKITAPVTFGENTLAPLINDFLKLYPKLDIQLHLTNQQLDLVAEGYDLALRLGKLADSSMMAKRLGGRTQYVCASPEYLKAHGRPLHITDLEQHNCLLGNLDYWRFQEQGQARKVSVRGNLRANSGWVLLDAALKGIGVVQLPDYYLRDALAHAHLVALLNEFTPADDGIWALYPHNRHLSPKVRLLLDFFSQRLPNATQI
ncbi:LysR substrate-binding domain-containing protein [Oceanisphaera avium]|uniref:LysR family transcriptional regulator n=1 Tax=Oceanisphaera avium TaxID=1903694 RepID=A0A1Y0CV20_9GAMM|nr:LysR substrate-binding domain-containing protein [Oceanisphaera avium]ART79193.1 LysR family transcriptional regulator [Oceanisphaera avium]